MPALLFALLLVLGTAAEGHAQQLPGIPETARAQLTQTAAAVAPGAPVPAVPAVPAAAGAPAPGQRMPIEIYLTLGVLLFGLVLAALEVLVILKSARGWDDSATRIVGITLIVVAGLFLVTAGYTAEQIAPVIGLLGTVAGYLLGKSTSDQAR